MEISYCSRACVSSLKPGVESRLYGILLYIPAIDEAEDIGIASRSVASPVLFPSNSMVAVGQTRKSRHMHDLNGSFIRVLQPEVNAIRVYIECPPASLLDDVSVNEAGANSDYM